MRLLLSATLFVSLCLLPAHADAQGLKAQQRAQELADSFSKSKHEIKEKHGVRVEKFKEIHSTPVSRNDVSFYAGTYSATFGDQPFTIQISTDGRIGASGSEPDGEQAREFTLRDAQIEGALLTGTKVYRDGTTQQFAGVFIDRTERDSPTDAGRTTFGLGVVFDPPKYAGELGFTLNHIFYQKQ
jgi:hypothetical protein